MGKHCSAREICQRPGSSWQTSQNRQGQQQGQCLQIITHASSAHTSVWEIACTTNLTSCPDGIFTDLFILFFSWTEINRGPMLETGKLHKGQQWNKAGTMPNADGLGGLLHSVHIKISSSQRTSCKTHRMLLLLSGWHLIQHPNRPGRPMNQALFHCHLSSGTLPAGIHLCHLLHSLVTRSYGLHLAIPALKYRI